MKTKFVNKVLVSFNTYYTGPALCTNNYIIIKYKDSILIYSKEIQFISQVFHRKQTTILESIKQRINFLEHYYVGHHMQKHFYFLYEIVEEANESFI